MHLLAYEFTKDDEQKYLKVIAWLVQERKMSQDMAHQLTKPLEYPVYLVE